MKRIVLVAVLALLSSCSSEPVRTMQARMQGFLQPSKGQAALSTGLRQYEDGSYAESAKSLQSSIDLGLGDQERIAAHKHLAFIHCVSSRERQCREEFRKALALDPTLELQPAEAGHPLWGPVFRSVKAGR